MKSLMLTPRVPALNYGKPLSKYGTLSRPCTASAATYVINIGRLRPAAPPIPRTAAVTVPMRERPALWQWVFPSQLTA